MKHNNQDTPEVDSYPKWPYHCPKCNSSLLRVANSKEVERAQGTSPVSA